MRRALNLDLVRQLRSSDTGGRRPAYKVRGGTVCEKFQRSTPAVGRDLPLPQRDGRNPIIRSRRRLQRLHGREHALVSLTTCAQD